jgi:hypothetical protein
MDESLTIGVPSRRCEAAEVVSSYWWFLHNEKSPATNGPGSILMIHAC